MVLRCARVERARAPQIAVPRLIVSIEESPLFHGNILNIRLPQPPGPPFLCFILSLFTQAFSFNRLHRH